MLIMRHAGLLVLIFIAQKVTCIVHAQITTRASDAPAAAAEQDGATAASAAVATASAGGMLLVPEGSNTAFPFSAVGQLANGCTGFLIGPCHVMTVAHCVLEPWRDIWWHGLDFYPGRCVMGLVASGLQQSALQTVLAQIHGGALQCPTGGFEAVEKSSQMCFHSHR